MNLISYQSRDELTKAHPEIKSFQMLVQIPRGMGIESARNFAAKAAQRRSLNIKAAYQIGNFVWIPAQTTPALPKECRCLEVIGDNGPCPEHGNPLAAGTD